MWMTASRITPQDRQPECPLRTGTEVRVRCAHGGCRSGHGGPDGGGAGSSSGPAATWSGPSGTHPAPQLEQGQGAGDDGWRLAGADDQGVGRRRAVEQQLARRPAPPAPSDARASPASIGRPTATRHGGAAVPLRRPSTVETEVERAARRCPPAAAPASPAAAPGSPPSRGRRAGPVPRTPRDPAPARGAP